MPDMQQAERAAVLREDVDRSGHEPDGSSHTAAFVEIHAFYYNIDRRLGRLLRLLFAKSQALGIVGSETPLLAVRVRSSAAYILLSIGVRCLLARAGRRLGMESRLRFLPDEGDVARFCFPDWVRVFDLGLARITNLRNNRDRGAPPAEDPVIKYHRRLGQLGLAPRVYEASLETGNYVEELCVGTPLRAKAWWNKDILERVNARARQIQQAAPPRPTTAQALLDELTGWLAKMEEECGVNIDDPDYAWLAGERRAAGRFAAAREEVPLYLSHGDAACRNVLLQEDGGVVFIDWLTVGYRIRDYDIYNYYFNLLWDDSDERLPEETMFEYLFESLQCENTSRALVDLDGFRLQFCVTRLSHFLLCADCDAGPARTQAVLGKMRDLTGIVGRYAGWLAA